MEKIEYKKYFESDIEEFSFDNIKKIEFSAFEGSKLKKIVLPDCVKDIEIAAFRDCKNLESVTIGKGLSIIDKNVFKDCENLKEVIFLGDIRRINENAFCNCKSLNKISFENVSYINDNAFENCENLEEVVSEKLSHIGTEAFKNCSKLKKFVTKVQFSKDYAGSVNYSAFSDCSELEYVELPKIYSLKNPVFSNCKKLSQVVFQDGITEISPFAFENCDSLLSMKLPDSVTKFDCKRIKPLNIPKNLEYLSSNFAHFFDLESNSFTIPEKIKNISNDFFKAFKNLETIILNENIVFSCSDFNDCNNIKNFVIQNNKRYAFEQNCLYDVNNGNLIYAICDGDVFTVPDFIKTVRGNCFHKELEKFIFNDDVDFGYSHSYKGNVKKQIEEIEKQAEENRKKLREQEQKEKLKQEKISEIIQAGNEGLLRFYATNTGFDFSMKYSESEPKGAVIDFSLQFNFGLKVRLLDSFLKEEEKKEKLSQILKTLDVVEISPEEFEKKIENAVTEIKGLGIFVRKTKSN